MNRRFVSLASNWWPAAAAALISLLPFIQCRESFQALFYFEDEWDLLDAWDKTGFRAWAGTVFAENFVPLFKTVWGGSIVLFGGSYFTLLLLLWLNHALNSALLCLLVQRLGCRWPVALVCAAAFGLSPLNHETLGWVVQWSAVLSLTFLLVPLLALVPANDHDSGSVSKSALACAMLAALASPLCFTRGILTGPVLAVVVFLVAHREPWDRRLVKSALLVLPSLAVALAVARYSSGNHQHLRDAWGPAFTFGLHYFAESPLRALFSDATTGPTATVLLAFGRLALAASAWWIVPRRLRCLVLALLIGEIGNAVLLGIGRYHTGLPAAACSRYQYAALLATLPLAAVLLDRLLGLFPRRAALVACALGLCSVTWHALHTWPPTMKSWRAWRGEQLRVALARPDYPDADHFTRLPWMTNERARELVRRFSLH